MYIVQILRIILILIASGISVFLIIIYLSCAPAAMTRWLCLPIHRKCQHKVNKYSICEPWKGSRLKIFGSVLLCAVRLIVRKLDKVEGWTGKVYWGNKIRIVRSVHSMWKFHQNDKTCDIVPKQVWSLIYLCAVLRHSTKKGHIQKGPRLFHNITISQDFVIYHLPCSLVAHRNSIDFLEFCVHSFLCFPEAELFKTCFETLMLFECFIGKIFNSFCNHSKCFELLIV